MFTFNKDYLTNFLQIDHQHNITCNYERSHGVA